MNATLIGTTADHTKFPPIEVEEQAGGTGRLVVAIGGAKIDIITPVNGSTELEVKFAAINGAASGNNAVVAAVTGKKIRVLAYVLIAAGTVDVKWRSASTDKSGAMSLVANAGISAQCQFGLIETAANEALNLHHSAAVQVSGHVVYVEV